MNKLFKIHEDFKVFNSETIDQYLEEILSKGKVVIHETEFPIKQNDFILCVIDVTTHEMQVIAKIEKEDCEINNTVH